MRGIFLASVAVLALSALARPADAWMHGYSGGGYTHSGDAGGWNHSTTVGAGGVSHSSDYGGYEHGTQATSSGVAHESDAGGYWHGSAANSQGAYHASDYGGYYHGTSVNASGATHTGYNGTTTTAYGSYYHQPVTVNSYGATCYNCGTGAWGVAGAAAAGAAVGAAVGVAATSVPVYTPVAAPPPVAAYAAVPAGCAWRPALQRYECGGTWLAPAYGANGLYYAVVPPP